MVTRPLELVKNGKVNFVIVTADKPDLIARHAALELQEHILKMCGTELSVVKENEKDTDGCPFYLYLGL